MADDDPLDPRKQDALARYSETRQREEDQSEVIDPPGRLLERAAIYIGLGMVVCALVILSVGQVDVIVKARGQMVPEQELIPIQSRNTGVLASVNITLGDTVEEGSVIATLGGDVAEADLQALERRIALQEQEAERRRAEVAATAELLEDLDQLSASDLDLSAFGDLVDRIQTLRLAQQEVARLSRLVGPGMERQRRLTANRIAALENTIAISTDSLDRLRAQLGTLEESVALREEQAERIEEFTASGLSTRTRALEVRDTVVSARIALNNQRERIGALELEISQTRLQIAEARQALAEEQDRRADALATAQRQEAGARSAVSAFFRERREALRALELEIDQGRDQLRFASRRAEALTIRAPATGTIASLRYAAPGARVVEGEEIARIVPEGVPNIVRASLPGKDAGRVEIGQSAVIKLDAFPFYRFGTVPATVTALFPEPQGTGFGVRLNLDRQTIGEDGTGDEIEAGMSATIEIVTERRRLIAIVLDRGRRAFSATRVDDPAAEQSPAGAPAQ